MHRTYLRLKGCPKCGGDILIDTLLEDGEVCIQCGFRNFRMADRPAEPQNLISTEKSDVRHKVRRRKVQV